jgi:signal transduction histidine kinase
MVITGAPEDLRLHADPLRLEQALGNLVDNALRHGGGTIVVRAERHGKTVELHVSDDGSGFPTAFVDSAFDRFARADPTRKTEGAGLGLAIVRSVARAHGGEAHVANRPGGGAHVWLSVPDGVAGEPAPATHVILAGTTRRA